MSGAIKSIILVIIYSIILIYTPRIFDVIENDTMGYIEFNDIRTSMYPTLIKMLLHINNSFNILKKVMRFAANIHTLVKRSNCGPETLILTAKK